MSGVVKKAAELKKCLEEMDFFFVHVDQAPAVGAFSALKNTVRHSHVRKVTLPQLFNVDVKVLTGHSPQVEVNTALSRLVKLLPLNTPRKSAMHRQFPLPLWIGSGWLARLGSSQVKSLTFVKPLFDFGKEHNLVLTLLHR